MDTVAVVVGSYGDLSVWGPLAERATESAKSQTVTPSDIIWRHDTTLQAARNGGAADTDADWLIFCDADDTLDAGYVEAMLHGEGDIRRPATLGVTDGVEDNASVLIPEADLYERNYIVIGALLRHELFDAVDGFRDLPALEDWDLFLRMYAAGATITACPDAIYRITVRSNSRNNNQEVHNRVYGQLRTEINEGRFRRKL